MLKTNSLENFYATQKDSLERDNCDYYLAGFLLLCSFIEKIKKIFRILIQKIFFKGGSYEQLPI